MISNGFDESRLLPVMKARKGWKQPTNADFTIVLDVNSVACASGIYYNLEHPCCIPENILDCQPDPEINDVNFNIFLDDLKQKVCVDAIAAVFPQEALIEPPKILFEKAYRTQYFPVVNSSKFCGWQVMVADGDYTTKVDSITLLMSAPCTVTLYCYNDLRAAAIWSKVCTVTTGNDQTILNIEDLALSRLNDINKGGVFYIGYYQDEIAAQGVTAMDVYLNGWMGFNMVGYRGFEAVSDYENKTFLRDNYYSNYKTYGLNLELSTYRDHTNTVIRNAQAFDKLQALMMVIACIELAMYSPRTNGQERNASMSYAALNQQLQGGMAADSGSQSSTSYKTGFKAKMESEVKRVQKTFFNDDIIEFSVPPVNDFRNGWSNGIR